MMGARIGGRASSAVACAMAGVVFWTGSSPASGRGPPPAANLCGGLITQRVGAMSPLSGLPSQSGVASVPALPRSASAWLGSVAGPAPQIPTLGSPAFVGRLLEDASSGAFAFGAVGVSRNFKGVEDALRAVVQNAGQEGPKLVQKLHDADLVAALEANGALNEAHDLESALGRLPAQPADLAPAALLDALSQPLEAGPRSRPDATVLLHVNQGLFRDGWALLGAWRTPHLQAQLKEGAGPRLFHAGVTLEEGLYLRAYGSEWGTSAEGFIGRVRIGETPCSAAAWSIDTSWLAHSGGPSNAEWDQILTHVRAALE